MTIHLNENPTTTLLNGSALDLQNSLLDCISDAVICTDMQMKVQYFNKNAEDIYGVKAADILGHSLSHRINYEYINDTRENAVHLLRETGRWQGKVIYTRPDKKAVYLLATVVYVYDDSGTQTGIIATMKDITTEEFIQRELKRVMIKTQENERSELGRELHDNVNQILAVIKLQLEFALENYDEGQHAIEKCQQNVDNVINEIRQLSHRLVLPRFVETSLKAELQKFTDMIPPVEINATGLHEELISDNIKATLYRIVQEQLNNIIKHAHASKTTITLHNDSSYVSLHIEDDGNGFDPAVSRNGVGITNILNRVESYNGKATIISAPGEGCRLLVTIPLQ